MKIKSKFIILAITLIVFKPSVTSAHGLLDFLDPVTSRISMLKDSVKNCKIDKKCYQERKEIKQLCDRNNSAYSSNICIRTAYKIPQYLLRREVIKLCNADHMCIAGAVKFSDNKLKNDVFIKQLNEMIRLCNGDDYCVFKSANISHQKERIDTIKLCESDGVCIDHSIKIFDHAYRTEIITLCERNTACIGGIARIGSKEQSAELLELCKGMEGCITAIGTLSHIPHQFRRIEIIKTCKGEELCIGKKYNIWYALQN